MATNVVNNRERSRYELHKDGSVIGFADYIVDGGRVIFPHTVIDPSQRGQGFGAVLVRQALDDVRSQGKRAVASCWYVAQFIDEHPDYKDLLEG